MCIVSKLLGGLFFYFFEHSEMLVIGLIFRSPSETPLQPFKRALTCCSLRRTEPLAPDLLKFSLLLSKQEVFLGGRVLSWEQTNKCSQTAALSRWQVLPALCSNVLRQKENSRELSERCFLQHLFILSLQAVPFPPSAGCVFPSENWMTESSEDLRWDLYIYIYFICLVNLGARLTCFVLLFHFGTACKEQEVWDNE